MRLNVCSSVLIRQYKSETFRRNKATLEAKHFRASLISYYPESSWPMVILIKLNWSMHIHKKHFKH